APARARSDDDLAATLRVANLESSRPAYAVRCARLREAVGDARYETIVRLADLGSQLDLPYTGTGAELMGEEEQRNVLEVLQSRRLWRYEVRSSESFVARFEEEAERLLGVAHVHATVSGTVALQIALLALGVGPGDEVVIPGLAWVGCADAVI